MHQAKLELVNESLLDEIAQTRAQARFQVDEHLHRAKVADLTRAFE
jgi:hypothetical protein